MLDPDLLGKFGMTAKHLKAFAKAMTAYVVEGEVVVLGPDAVALSLTPDAAEESGRRLLEAARRARGDAENQLRE